MLYCPLHSGCRAQFYMCAFRELLLNYNIKESKLVFKTWMLGCLILVIRGEPNLINNESQVSVPLNISTRGYKLLERGGPLPQMEVRQHLTSKGTRDCASL